MISIEITVNSTIYSFFYFTKELMIVYPICCGLNAQKTILMITIAKTDDKNITTYETREFTSINSSILSLKQWLLNNNCKDLCMGSTSKYWIPIFNIGIDKILTDCFEKSGTNIMKCLIENKNGENPT